MLLIGIFSFIWTWLTYGCRDGYIHAHHQQCTWLLIQSSKQSPGTCPIELIVEREKRKGRKGEARLIEDEYVVTLQNGDVDVWTDLWHYIWQGVRIACAWIGLWAVRCIQRVTTALAAIQGGGDFWRVGLIRGSPKNKQWEDQEGQVNLHSGGFHCDLAEKTRKKREQEYKSDLWREPD